MSTVPITPEKRSWGPDQTHAKQVREPVIPVDAESAARRVLTALGASDLFEMLGLAS